MFLTHQAFSCNFRPAVEYLAASALCKQVFISCCASWSRSWNDVI